MKRLFSGRWPLQGPSELSPAWNEIFPGWMNDASGPRRRAFLDLFLEGEKLSWQWWPLAF